MKQFYSNNFGTGNEDAHFAIKRLYNSEDMNAAREDAIRDTIEKILNEFPNLNIDIESYVSSILNEKIY